MRTVLLTEIWEVIETDLEGFVDLLCDRLSECILLSDISWSVIGHKDNDLFIAASASCDNADAGYDPKVDEFDEEELPDTFRFKSTLNCIGGVYHAERDGLDYIVRWSLNKNRILNGETRYTKTEMVRFLKDNTFALYDN